MTCYTHSPRIGRKLQRGPIEAGCVGLALAVIERAVADGAVHWRRAHHHQSPVARSWARRDYRETAEWFDSDAMDAGSMRWWCAVGRVDPDWVRAVFRRVSR